MHKVWKWVSGLVVALAATSASALPVQFTYSGTCSTNCGALGLAAGGAVSGAIFTDDSFLLDGFVSSTDITNWFFDFGDADFNTGNGSIFPTTNLMLNGAQDGFAAGSLFVINTADFEIGIVQEAADTWQINQVGFPPPSGSGSFARVSNPPAPTPEPGALALVAVGLLALGVRRRRTLR